VALYHLFTCILLTNKLKAYMDSKIGAYAGVCGDSTIQETGLDFELG
jgi:hypothetical protein